MIDFLTHTLNKVAALRSQLGAQINRLNHTRSHLEGMQQATILAEGELRDADWAKEFSNITRQDMLKNLSTSLIKENHALDSMMLSLVELE